MFSFCCTTAAATCQQRFPSLVFAVAAHTVCNSLDSQLTSHSRAMHVHANIYIDARSVETFPTVEVF